MKNTPTYHIPVVGSTASRIDPARYDRSIELFDEGKHLESFHMLLDYLNSEFRTKYGNADGTEFHIPHGSILVNIRITDGRLCFSADFLSLPEKNRVAMLRQVAELNINRLLLPEFRKQGDLLKMEYECPLSQSYPHKIYFVLRNICHTGDRYDDEFCSKFGAVRTYEPQVTAYSPDEIRRIHEAVQQVCRETLDLVAEYDGDRRYGYSWNVLDTAFYKIAYFARMQGQLMNDLEKAVEDMDRELPAAELVAKGKVLLERLLTMSCDEMARDLYFVDTLVSTKRRSSLNNVQENFKDVFKETTEAVQAGSYEHCVVRILYKFYEIYFYNDLQEDLNVVVARALERSAGKSVEEASEILYDALDKIMDGELGMDDDLSESIFGVAEQQQVAAMESEVADVQVKMQEAMARGDMSEYMRLATEFQQKMMAQVMGKME